MSLKTRSSVDGQSPLHDPWSGLWGSVVPDVKSLSMLRVELRMKDGRQDTYAFAYSSLSRWICRRMLNGEEWELSFGKQLVRVEGRRLARLIDALDEGRLKLVRICPATSIDEEPWIKELTVMEPGHQSYPLQKP